MGHFARFPGFEDEAPGLRAAVGTPGIYGFAALVGISGLLEVLIWQQYDFAEPGNFGDPLGLAMYDKDTRNKEINNGRLAMFTAAGIIAAELYTGRDAVQQIFGKALGALGTPTISCTASKSCRGVLAGQSATLKTVRGLNGCSE